MNWSEFSRGHWCGQGSGPVALGGAEGPGLVQPGEEVALRGPVSGLPVPRRILFRRCSQAIPSIVLVGQWEILGVNWNERFRGEISKSFFTIRTVTQWTVAQRGCVVSILRGFKTDWIKPWATWSDIRADAALSSGLD